MFGKIEDLINHLLIKLGQLLLRLVPNSLKKRVHELNKKIEEKKKKMSSSTQKFLTLSISKLLYLPGLIKIAMMKVSSFLIALSPKLKNTTAIKEAIARGLSPLSNFIVNQYKKLEARLAKLTPKAMVFLIVITAMVMLASMVIVGNTKKIYQSSSEEIVQEEVAPQQLRKDYYQQDEKQLLVSEVTIPIYVGTGNAPRTLILDMTIKTSNRYLKFYFFENDYLLKDRLNRTIEPIIPTLPLEEEGKRIIREKIINEINQLIKEQKVKGHIEDVYFHNIING